MCLVYNPEPVFVPTCPSCHEVVVPCLDGSHACSCGFGEDKEADCIGCSTGKCGRDEIICDDCWAWLQQ